MIQTLVESRILDKGADLTYFQVPEVLDCSSQLKNYLGKLASAVEIQHRFQGELLDVLNCEFKSRPTHTQITKQLRESAKELIPKLPPSLQAMLRPTDEVGTCTSQDGIICEDSLEMSRGGPVGTIEMPEPKILVDNAYVDELFETANIEWGHEINQISKRENRLSERLEWLTQKQYNDITKFDTQIQLLLNRTFELERKCTSLSLKLFTKQCKFRFFQAFKRACFEQRKMRFKVIKMFHKSTIQQKRIGLSKFLKNVELERKKEKEAHFMKHDREIKDLFGRSEGLSALCDELDGDKATRSEFHKLAISIQNHRAFQVLDDMKQYVDLESVRTKERLTNLREQFEKEIDCVQAEIRLKGEIKDLKKLDRKIEELKSLTIEEKIQNCIQNESIDIKHTVEKFMQQVREFNHGVRNVGENQSSILKNLASLKESFSDQGVVLHSPMSQSTVNPASFRNGCLACEETSIQQKINKSLHSTKTLAKGGGMRLWQRTEASTHLPLSSTPSVGRRYPPTHFIRTPKAFFTSSPVKLHNRKWSQQRGSKGKLNAQVFTEGLDISGLAGVKSMDAFDEMDSEDHILKPTDSLEGGGVAPESSRLKFEEQQKKKTRMPVLTHRATSSVGGKSGGGTWSPGQI